MVHDAFRRADLHDFLQPVVAVDDAPVEVVQVGGGEAAAIQLHHRPQLRWDDGNDFHDHPVRSGARTDEGFHHIQPLDGAHAPRPGDCPDSLLQLASQGFQVNFIEQLADCRGAQAGLHPTAGLRAHASGQDVQQPLLGAVLFLGNEQLHLRGVDEVGGGFAHLVDAFDDSLLLTFADLLLLRLEPLCQLGRFRLDLFRSQRLFGRFVPEVVEFILLLVLAFEPSDFFRQPASKLFIEAAEHGHALRLHLHDLRLNGITDLLGVVIDGRPVHPGDDIAGEVHHLFQRTRGDVKNKRQRARHPLQVPDVPGWRGQLNVAHPLAADVRAGDLHAAAVTDHSLELDLLIAPAVALPVLNRAEDALTEQAIPFRFEGAVVDGLRLLDFAVGPLADVGGRGDADPNRFEAADVGHLSSPWFSALAVKSGISGTGETRSIPRPGRWAAVAGP